MPLPRLTCPLLLVIACTTPGGGEGRALPDGSCRVLADCPSGRTCVAPGDPVPCGIPCQPHATCASDADCAATDLCESYLETCCVPGDPTSTRCVPPCTAGSCAAGTACAASGRCEPVACAAGYACPAHTRCDAAAAGADPHGCLRRTCTDDSACESAGWCVNGACHEAAGACRSPAP